MYIDVLVLIDKIDKIGIFPTPLEKKRLLQTFLFKKICPVIISVLNVQSCT